MALTGGPPVRGTKLRAWTLPPNWKAIEQKRFAAAPGGSLVPRKQRAMLAATRDVLKQIAEDVREGLLETVGIESEFSVAGGRASMMLELPAEVDAAIIAQAIALENADAWCDEGGRVHLGIDPWFSIKDVDQTVLCAIKVIHVLLGMHAVCELKPRSLKQRIISSVSEILQIQQKINKR